MMFAETKLLILLADDDADDCMFFQEAIEELKIPVNLQIVNDGEKLMEHLKISVNDLPGVIFLDLNMPRKNGFECLEEIKKNKKLSQIPLIIISTSFDEDIANRLYAKGANFYICKPSDFSIQKAILRYAIKLITLSSDQQPRNEFLLNKSVFKNPD